MSSHASREPVTEPLPEEENLLVEAVSLLMRRQRETETWAKEQICRAEERAAASEQRCAEIEARLQAVEDRLAQLIPPPSVDEPQRAAAAPNEQLIRLREELDALKSSTDGTPSGSPPSFPAANGRQPPEAAETLRGARGGEPVEAPASPGADVPSAPRAEPSPLATAGAEPVAVASVGRPVGGRSTLRDLLGASPHERFGLVLIGAGAVAVLYAILSQLHLG